MYKKIVLILTISSFALVAFSSEDGGHHHRRMMDLDSEVKEKIANYKDENILPKMTEWKSKIDASLSSDELHQLNELRSKASQIRDESKGKIQELMADREAGESVEKDEFKSIMRDSKKQFKELAKQLKPIAENNKDLLIEIGEEAKIQKEKWHKEIEEIISQGNSNDQHKKRKRHKKGEKRDKDGRKAMARLLLWDGKSMDFEDQGLAPKSKNEINSKAYPNPFDSGSNINFDLPKSEFVTVEIYDESGNLIETLYEGEMEEGEQNLKFNPKNGTGAGTYIYKIESNSINETGKLIMKK